MLFRDERRDSIKLIDWKSGTVSPQMLSAYEETHDCKLGFIQKQLSMYAYMLKTLFHFQQVDAVAVFCSKTGFVEMPFHLAADATVAKWILQFSGTHDAPRYDQSDRKVMESSMSTINEHATRLQPVHVLDMPPARPKGRPRLTPAPFQIILIKYETQSIG